MERKGKLLRANPLCAICLMRGLATQAMEVDHVIPLHQGGLDVDSNTQNLCVDCHKEKTKRDGSRWRKGEA